MCQLIGRQTRYMLTDKADLLRETDFGLGEALMLAGYQTSIHRPFVFVYAVTIRRDRRAAVFSNDCAVLPEPD